MCLIVFGQEFGFGWEIVYYLERDDVDNDCKEVFEDEDLCLICCMLLVCYIL